MDFPQRAVFFLEEDSSLPAHSKPLMLEAVLFCPILKWMSDKLLADGVQRFFAVSSPRFAQEVRACFPEDADVTISEQHSELLDFLNTPDPVAVFVRAALPMEEAGPGFVYGAAGYELQAVWQEKMTRLQKSLSVIRINPFITMNWNWQGFICIYVHRPGCTGIRNRPSARYRISRCRRKTALSF